MIPLELNNYWKNYTNNQKEIIVFYSHKNGEYKCFSNFYISTFDYEIKHGIFKNKLFSVEFAEKAIMLSKASIMNDTETFLKILKVFFTSFKSKANLLLSFPKIIFP